MEKHDVRDLMEEVIEKNLDYVLDHGVGDETAQKALKNGMDAYKAFTEMTKVDDSHSEQEDKLAFEKSKFELDREKAAADAKRLEIEEKKIEVEEKKLALEEKKFEQEKINKANEVMIAKKSRIKDVIIGVVGVVGSTVLGTLVQHLCNKSLSTHWKELEQDEILTNKGAQGGNRMFKF